MHAAKKYTLRMALLCAAALAGCENMMQDIDVKLTDFPPKLAVSASIDTDSGTFRLYFTEARSLAYYKTWQSESKAIIRKGTVSLYEDDSLIYSIVDGGSGQGFDMSLRSGDASGFSVEQKGLTFKAGSAYKLALHIGDYPIATAAVVMPDAPGVEDVALDTARKVHRQRPYFVNNGNGYLSTDEMDFYALSLRLTDGSHDRDYYMFQGKATTTLYHHDYLDGDNTYTTWFPVAVANRALIQDNPDLEGEELFINTEPDVFLFNRMLVSDMSFANATGAIDLLLPEMYVKPTYLNLLCDTTSQPYVRISTEICISHLSPITYEHHLSLALQRDEVGFFTEPVSIASNIENGVGCFAAFNTVRKTVLSTYGCSWEMPYY
jgi:hypothetical protein